MNYVTLLKHFPDRWILGMQGVVVCQTRGPIPVSTSGESGSNSGRTRPSLGRTRPKSVDSGPNVGQIRRMASGAHAVCPAWAGFDQLWIDIGRFRPQIWRESTKLEAHWPGIG